MRILVVGAGRVGLVAAAGFARDGHQVVCAEQDPQRLAALTRGTVPFFEPGLDSLVSEAVGGGRLLFIRRTGEAQPCEAVVIAVGTPSLEGGDVDLQYVTGAVREVVEWARQPVVMVMKSTVPPGTGTRIQRQFLDDAAAPVRYAANPEFLREGHAVDDWFHPARTVIGTESPEARSLLRSLYGHIDAPLYEMDVTTAEMVKYASNAFLATKVSFINEIANLCEALGADVIQVAQVMGADPRIGPDHLQAGVGYGGSCFPKDTRALNALSDASGYAFRLLKAVIEVNADMRRRAVERVAQALGGRLRGARVAVLGLAFKAHTDDVRGSAALEIVTGLVQAGAHVAAWDPRAVSPARLVLPGSVAYARDAYEACQDAQAVMVLTAWPEFITLDWARVHAAMRPPRVIFDGRNALLDDLEAKGFVHLRVGRSPRPAPAAPVRSLAR